MKRLLRVLGLAALLMGLLWMGQGSGVIMWPKSSFMLDQRIWTLWGALLAAVGVVALVISRRRR